MHNLSYENKFYLTVHVNGNSFHMKGCASKLALKKRYETTLGNGLLNVPVQRRSILLNPVCLGNDCQLR